MEMNPKALQIDNTIIIEMSSFLYFYRKKYSPMRFVILLTFIVLSTALLDSCRKGNIISGDQKILFQYSYVNYAWGTNNQGFLIDNEGNLLIYNQPEKWNFPDKNSTLSQAQVAENLSYCTATGRKVTEAELQKYASYIVNLAASKVTAKKAVAADMGTFNYYCFSYSSGSSSYRQVTIKTLGDFECENLNFYTKKVVEWMNQMMQGLSIVHH
jgi:hypothetical protein